MLVSLGANAEHGKRREAGDYRKAYDIACRYKLMPPADTGAVAKLLRCSDRWARELTAEARQRERAEREEAIVRAHDDGKTVREIAEDTGVHNSTVVRALAAKGKPSVLQQEAEDPGPGPDPYADARVIYGPVAPLGPPAAAVANEGPAVSGAAATMLIHLYPSFRSVVDDALRGFDFGAADPAFAFGVAVANQLIAARQNDGSDDGGSVPGIGRYWQHREDPTDLGQGFLGQRWGTVQPFSMAAIPPIADHPVPRSDPYNRAHDQVRIKGSATGTSGTPGENFTPRTPLQTLIGIYWAYDGASQIGTPPRQYNQIIREVIGRNVNGADRTAASVRLLTLANVAMADAGIAAWHHKYRYQLWRPVLGIREYDDSFWYNGNAVSYLLHKRCDPWWVPLGAPRTNEPGRGSFSPPFPAYPSGHATFGAAAFESARLFFGVGQNAADNLFFDLVSDELDGRAIHDDGSFRGRHRRHHDSLLRAMFDNAVSRVFLGVHWRFDGLGENVQNHQGILADNSNVGGVPLGRAIAQDIFANGMPTSQAPRAQINPVMLNPV